MIYRRPSFSGPRNTTGTGAGRLLARWTGAPPIGIAKVVGRVKESKEREIGNACVLVGGYVRNGSVAKVDQRNRAHRCGQKRQWMTNASPASAHPTAHARRGNDAGGRARRRDTFPPRRSIGRRVRARDALRVVTRQFKCPSRRSRCLRSLLRRARCATPLRRLPSADRGPN